MSLLPMTNLCKSATHEEAEPVVVDDVHPFSADEEVDVSGAEVSSKSS